jgi:hypothetical protein
MFSLETTVTWLHKSCQAHVLTQNMVGTMGNQDILQFYHLFFLALTGSEKIDVTLSFYMQMFLVIVIKT